MTSSTLDPDQLPLGSDRKLGRGHGTGALGPSDSSDTGSDVQGAPGLSDSLDGDEEDVGLSVERARGAGPDLGDVDLDSDTDSAGTGERAGAGRDTVAPDGADIDVDHIETIPPIPDDIGDDEEVRPGRR